MTKTNHKTNKTPPSIPYADQERIASQSRTPSYRRRIKRLVEWYSRANPLKRISRAEIGALHELADPMILDGEGGGHRPRNGAAEKGSTTSLLN